MSGWSSGGQSRRWAAGWVRIRGRFTVMKASFSESLSAREDWVQDILGYYTKSLPNDLGKILLWTRSWHNLDKIIWQDLARILEWDFRKILTSAKIAPRSCRDCGKVLAPRREASEDVSKILASSIQDLVRSWQDNASVNRPHIGKKNTLSYWTKFYL